MPDLAQRFVDRHAAEFEKLERDEQKAKMAELRAFAMAKLPEGPPRPQPGHEPEDTEAWLDRVYAEANPKAKPAKPKEPKPGKARAAK